MTSKLQSGEGKRREPSLEREEGTVLTRRLVVGFVQTSGVGGREEGVPP